MKVNTENTVITLSKRETFPMKGSVSVSIDRFELMLCTYGKTPSTKDIEQLNKARIALYAYDLDSLQAYCIRWFKVDAIDRALMFAATNQFPLSEGVFYVVR